MNPSDTDPNDTASQRSDSEQSKDAVTPFLTLCARSGVLSGSVFRVALRADVHIGRDQETSLSQSRGKDPTRFFLDDKQASRQHAQFVLDGRAWRLLDLESKNGTYLNGARVQSAILRDGDIIRVGSYFFLYRVDSASATQTSTPLRLELGPSGNPFDTLLPSLETRFAELTNLASTRLPILIHGQNGTGKELVAGEIHARSGRRGRFVGVNCGAIPESLLESELFGHKKGAFSGAVTEKDGLFRAADRGTLFLDEIGELSERSQVALLRVLQEREVRPVGSTSAISVDVRVIAASHQDLPKAVEEGRFRHDLYARIVGHAISLPTLNDRREDLGLIVSALAARLGGQSKQPLDWATQAMQTLLCRDYSLNIRELEHLIERAVALAGDGKRIEPSHVRAVDPTSGKVPVVAAEDAALAERLREVLRETRGNIAATSRAFGKAPMQIRRWCERFDIDYRRYR